MKTKPWFDKECSEIKHKITKMGKKLRGDRENKELRNELFQLKSKLKKTVRKKKRLHKKTILQEMELCTSTSQKKYWKLLGKLEEKENNTTHYVSPKNLVNHYKALLNSKRDLNIPPNSTNAGKLDYPITPLELYKAKHTLKRGKANGIDTLNNEMISSFIEIHPHIILDLFNCILDKNITINDWP